MNTLSIKDIQSISLDILSDIHQFCMENGIRYSLAYGTLIGAIRHKGFIPWDDDADIMMPRPDYIRFCQTFKSSRFRVISEYDADSYIQYARVYDAKDTLFTSYSPRSKNYQGGVWIDVFPLDGAEEDYDAFVNRSKKLCKLRIWQVRFRDAKADLSKVEDKKLKLRLIAKRIVYLNGIFLKLVNKKMSSLGQKIPYGQTKYWSDFMSIDDSYNWEYQALEDFQDTILVPFEDRELCICTGYDRVLRQYYGDYMQLPPEEKRKPYHIWQSFVWKDKE